MAGICGWTGAGAGALEAMARSLAHRGGVACLPEAGAGDLDVVVDSPFNTAAEAREAWRAAQGDPRAFASSLACPFAVAVRDRPRRRLVLARDRLGEKPLYYRPGPRGVAFASEIKALRDGGALRGAALHGQALDAYLAFTYIPAPWTIYEGVSKVPAGHAVVFAIDESGAVTGAGEPARYWRLPDRTGDRTAPEGLIALLSAALRRRMPAGDRVAAFLSGGLDSGVVTALAREAGRRPITFSAAFDDDRLDESAHARAIAGRVGSEHHEIKVGAIDVETVVRVVEALDEPLADAATIPTWLLAREVSKVASIVLTGDGADALFAGDHWYRRLRRMESLERLPRPIRQLLPAGASIAGRRQRERYRSLTDLIELPAAERYLRTREKWTPAERLAIYAGPFREAVDVTATEATYLEAPVTWRPRGSVDAAIRLDAIHGLPEDLLMKADKMGMAHGVECRSPFMDPSIAEWAARADVDLLLKDSTSKYLLKKAAESLLPRDLVHRRKQGFQVPMGRWLAGPLRDLTEAAFDPSLVRRQGIFDPAALADLRSGFDAGSPSPALAGKVWQIVAFQTWWTRSSIFRG